MPDPQTPDKQDDKKPDIDSIVEKLNKSITEKMSVLDDKLDELRPKGEGKKEKEEEDIFSTMLSEDSEDDIPITKKDLESFGKEIATRVLGEARKIADKTYDEKATKQSRDFEAGRDFPLMNQASKDFSMDFVKDVEKEMRNRTQAGRSREDRDLVYDSAASVYAKWINDGKYIPRKSAERETQENNNREDSFEFSGRRTGTSKGPNERQLQIGKQLGLSADKVKQAIEKQRKSS